MNDRDPTMREMFNYDRTKYEINWWKLILVAGVILSIGIWYSAWLAPRMF